MGLCSHRGGKPLLCSLIIKAVALLPNRAFHRPKPRRHQRRGRRRGEGGEKREITNAQPHSFSMLLSSVQSGDEYLDEWDESQGERHEKGTKI